MSWPLEIHLPRWLSLCPLGRESGDVPWARHLHYNQILCPVFQNSSCLLCCFGGHSRKRLAKHTDFLRQTNVTLWTPTRGHRPLDHHLTLTLSPPQGYPNLSYNFFFNILVCKPLLVYSGRIINSLMVATQLKEEEEP